MLIQEQLAELRVERRRGRTTSQGPPLSRIPPRAATSITYSPGPARRAVSSSFVEAQVADRLAVAPDKLKRLDTDLDMPLNWELTLASEASVLSIGDHRLVRHQQQAPLAMWLAKPAANTVAVSMSMASSACPRCSLNGLVVLQAGAAVEHAQAVPVPVSRVRRPHRR
jgi:hypothetical protein